MTDDAFTLVFAGDIRNFPNPLRTETPFGIAIGAADRDLMAGIENEEAVEALSLTVSPLPDEIADICARLSNPNVTREPLNDDLSPLMHLRIKAAAALDRMARENERLSDEAEEFRADVAKLEGDNERLKLLVSNADDEHDDQCHELDARAARIQELEAEITRLTDPPNPPLTMNDALALLAAQGREIGRLTDERDAIKAKTIKDASEALLAKRDSLTADNRHRLGLEMGARIVRALNQPAGDENPSTSAQEEA